MKILATRGIGSEIEDIIKYAKKEITLVSPYLKIEQRLFDLICRAGNKGVVINIVYGKEDLMTWKYKKYQGIPNCKLYFNKTLHAKAYLNESHAVLSSMNLYEFSESNNMELGVVCTKEKDKNHFDDIEQEVDIIIQSSLLKHSNIPKEVSEIEKRIGDKIQGKGTFEIEHFPKKNITLSSQYGYASFFIDYKHYPVEEIKREKFEEWESHFKERGFNLYWNYKGLCLYDDKSIFKRSKSPEQIIEGIDELNELVKTHIQ